MYTKEARQDAENILFEIVNLKRNHPQAWYAGHIKFVDRYAVYQNVVNRSYQQTVDLLQTNRISFAEADIRLDALSEFQNLIYKTGWK